MEEKEQRIRRANDAIAKLGIYEEKIRSKELDDAVENLRIAVRDLRDTQYLFDSGEKELIRLYERYLPYFWQILDQYLDLQDSGNYDAIVRNGEHLQKTIDQMISVVRSVIQILPQDEIDEANAKARAEELRRMLEEQRNNVVK